MISVKEELIDRLTATLHYLRTGKVPLPMVFPLWVLVFSTYILIENLRGTKPTAAG